MLWGPARRWESCGLLLSALAAVLRDPVPVHHLPSHCYCHAVLKLSGDLTFILTLRATVFHEKQWTLTDLGVCLVSVHWLFSKSEKEEALKSQRQGKLWLPPWGQP